MGLPRWLKPARNDNAEGVIVGRGFFVNGFYFLMEMQIRIQMSGRKMGITKRGAEAPL